MVGDPFQKYSPRDQWKKWPTLKEPETEDRYTRCDVGYYALPTMEELINARDFDPPRYWRDYGKDARYDKFFLEVFDPEYSVQSMSRMNAPVPISAQLIMAKSICRTARMGSVDKRAVLMWVNFPRIEPCWYLMGARQNYWLLSEEELGIKHGKKIGADA